MPMDPTTAALAMTAATTIVGAMATSTWETARTWTVQLFQRRGRSPQEVEAQLDRSVVRVTRAEDSGTARETQILRWRDDLEDLLSEHPDAADDLESLVREVQQLLPPVQQQWIAHVIAHGGIAAGAVGPGSGVHIHNYSGSGQVRPAASEPNSVANTGDAE
ncbi:hypothetical protein [Saccharothrix saharensis]|uniref:hypothetical protein n=1 Tax=Saccharothrix saharensis TaxID=571190 RepID=UPI001151D53A|nr:hypothetical protein [Saccharothrix saharensis]